MTYEQTINIDNLREAWFYILTKGRVGGIDLVSIDIFAQVADAEIEILHNELKTEKYRQNVYQSVVFKEDEEDRKIALLTIRDKIVQQAVRTIIEPHYEAQFINVSYGYRRNRGAIRAINRTIDRLKAEKREWISICDIQKFFDNIPLNDLFAMLENDIADPKLMRLIRMCVQMGKVKNGMEWVETISGVPQGAILSPLLSNIYLHRLDVFLTEKNYGLIRYADDFIILSYSQKEAQTALKDTRLFIENELKLSLHPDAKVKKVTTGFEFLGLWFQHNRTMATPEKLERLKQKIDNSFRLEYGQIGKKFVQTITGISRYYVFLIPQKQLEELDEQIVETLKAQLANNYQKGKIPDKKLIENQLFTLNFLSKQNQLDKRALVREIMRACRKKKKDKRSNENKVLTVEQVIGKRRLEYMKIEAVHREAVVTTPGVFIGKKRKTLTIKEKGKKVNEISLKTLNYLTILASGVSISSDAIAYCASHNIVIDFVGFDGIPTAKLLPTEYENADIALGQIYALKNNLGIQFIKNIVEAKIKNQLHLIKYIGKYRCGKDPDFTEAFDAQTNIMKQMATDAKNLNAGTREEAAATLFGIEGRAAAAYWDMVEKMLNDYTSTFTKRVHQGATDLVNSMLNYGYGMLYGRIHSACILAHLNPFVSYLHATQNGKPTLTFDLIEQFRQQVVDRQVFSLVTKGEKLKMKGGFLEHNTKNRVAQKILERLAKTETFRGKKMRLSDIINYQVKMFAQYVVGNEKNYKPYVAKW